MKFILMYQYYIGTNAIKLCDLYWFFLTNCNDYEFIKNGNDFSLNNLFVTTTEIMRQILGV